MPALSKPQAPISGLPLVVEATACSPATGVEVSDEVVFVVDVGGGFDPHAAKNRVAASSCFFTHSLLFWCDVRTKRRRPCLDATHRCRTLTHPRRCVGLATAVSV